MCIIKKPPSFLLERPESIGIARTHRQNDPSEEREQALAAEQEKNAGFSRHAARKNGKTENRWPTDAIQFG